MSSLEKIEHVVVLMLENRSFDCMLGRLYPKSAGFDGLAGTETNPDNNGNPVQVWSGAGTAPPLMTTPDPDPGELFTDMNMQIFGVSPTPTPATPTMSGFVRSYLAQTTEPPGSYAANSVMHYFSPEQVPVISRLARQFAVSDRWHASAPCQTWPNRFFMHTATANGYENNSPTHFPYEMPTIFNRFDQFGVAGGWKVYFHDVPQSLTLSQLWPHLERFRFYEEFRHDAKMGSLPAYSFIEPRYFSDISLPNDEHPPHVVTLGEQLTADVYNCLRAGPAWTKTLLIITYDEHGGCFDHVPPPPAQPPAATPTVPFNFDRYGVRVPAVLVSPYIRQGTVLRPPGATPFDHTSIIKTLRHRFQLGPALTLRDEAAPDLGDALALDDPENMGPPAIEALPYVPGPAEVAAAQQRPLNNMQEALLRLAAHLPANASTVDDHIQRLIDMKRLDQTIAVATNVLAGEALGTIKARLSGLFATL
jgi:phospholipase C